GYMEQGIRHLMQEGTPQGSVISPLFSNIYLNQFDHEMESRGYKLTRFADDWVVLCRTRGEAIKALEEAIEVLKSLGLTIHPEKTKITHINKGFEFLGYKLKRGKGLKLAKNKIKKRMNSSNIYAFPKEESIKRFKATIKERTKRKIPLTTKEIIDRINPVIRGWGIYYRKAHVRKLFNKLQRWIVRRIWSHRYKRWRNYGWKYYNERRLYSEFKLVNLLTLIPDLRLKTVSI
ncbi:MAG: reverse transcriptase domain-containing protein, partial [Candidatus Atribacteria bacterium]|nr:reverse transcriptase domain-containing protein [Candidatus Atribacteria bacterium]